MQHVLYKKSRQHMTIHC